MCGIKIGFNTREEAREFIRENYRGKKNKIVRKACHGKAWTVIL